MSLENYETVAERLARWLSTSHAGQPRVITDMISQPGADCAVFKAELWIDTVLIATGWAEEIRGQGNVNRTSHVENCETSAIGRALANAGVAGSNPANRASREEMQKVQRATTSNASANASWKHERNAHERQTEEIRQEVDRGLRTMTGVASDKQIGYIKGACKREGCLPPATVEGWSKQEASEWIEAHKNGTPAKVCPQPDMSEEEPF